MDPQHQLHRQKSPAATVLLIETGEKTLPPPVFTTFYRLTTQIILSCGFMVCYSNCYGLDHKIPAEDSEDNPLRKIRGSLSPLPQTLTPSTASAKPPELWIIPHTLTHLTHTLFCPLPCAQRIHCKWNSTVRTANSFFPQISQSELNHKLHPPPTHLT